jgi:hypothetical protein
VTHETKQGVKGISVESSEMHSLLIQMLQSQRVSEHHGKSQITFAKTPAYAPSFDSHTASNI